MCRKPVSPNDCLQRNPFLLICHFHANSENATRCKLCAFFSGVKLCLINPKWREASQKYQLSVAINVVLVKPTTHSKKLLTAQRKEISKRAARAKLANHRTITFYASEELRSSVNIFSSTTGFFYQELWQVLFMLIVSTIILAKLRTSKNETFLSCILVVPSSFES